MYQKLLEMLLAKYGHLPYSELTEALRKDGLGEFVDAIENDPQLMGLMSEISQELIADGYGDSDYGIMPSTGQQISGTPIEYHGTFPFDPHACLTKCQGNCCKNKNYLMIGITDIFRMISAKGAEYFDIHSTIDLFERTPPFVELFYNEEYRMFFPYIRYLPVDADVHTRPEDADASVCPFLRPIDEVYAYHNQDLPQWANKEAWGCLLMQDKPLVCRLSPLGQSHGMVTGNVTYEFLPPAPDCPACETDIEVKVSDYVPTMVSFSEQQQQKQFHQMLMSYHQAEKSQEFDQNYFNEIIRHVYNIDKLLSQYRLGTEHRPQVEQLVQIVFAASYGDFTVYEQFIESLRDKIEK